MFGQIDYLQDIQPIFNNHCISCHSGTYGSGALELDSFERLIEGDSNNGPVVLPFNADSSLLYKVLLRDSVIVPNEPICCRMPKNADFVVIQENTWRQGNLMYVNDYDKKSSYVRKTGLDFKKGQIISNPMLIDYKLISALASLNLEKISVIKKPKVCIIPTGNEILALGSKPKKNSIYSSSPYGIKALLENEGAYVTIAPICRDTIDDIAVALKKTEQAQIIITLGGVSKGSYDVIRRNYKRLGIKVLVNGLPIRPGKPIIIGTLGNKIIFCLPGNPISSIVCSRLFIVELIRKILGGKNKKLQTRKAVLYTDVKCSTTKREHYMRAFTFQEGTTQYVKPFSRQDSSLHSVLVKSNCLVIVPPLSSMKLSGEIVDIVDI